MEFKGTKGKWKINEDYIQSANSKQMIADCFPTTDEDRANALLISKAPEMLETLKHLYSDLKQGALPSEAEIQNIKQLIKEATELQ